MENLEMFRKRHRDNAADGRTRVCEPRLFFAAYALGHKCLSAKDIKRLTERLFDTGAIDEDTGEWTALPAPRTKPINGDYDNPVYKKEDEHFRELESVVEQVLSVAEELFPRRFSPEKRTTKFMCRPNRITHSEIPGSSQRIDCVFVRRQSAYPAGFRSGGGSRVSVADAGDQTVKVCTADVTAAGELKLEITPLSILDAKKWFIEFILFNTYASLPALGIDPTVTRVLDDEGQLQYQFDIYPATSTSRLRKPVTYQTKTIIDESSALTVYCRAMRVYDVRLVIENSVDPKKRLLDDNPNVLRDYWVYDDVKDELVIQRDIQRRMRRIPAIWEDAEKHFMGIKEDGVVRYPITKGKARDTVPSPPEGAAPFTFEQDDNPAGSGPSNPQLEGASNLRSAKALQGPIATAPEVQAQLCRVLYHVDNPALFFHALSEVVKILRLFKCIGYVHRDVSPGNFLLYHLSGKLPELPSKVTRAVLDQWVTIVSDLEYARPYDAGAGHDPITGTSYYTAIEVQGRKYAFVQQPDNVMFRPTNAVKDDLNPTKNFTFNFYHDAESALWMGIEFIIRKMPKTLLAGEHEASARVLRDYAAKLFTQNRAGSTTRTAHIEKLSDANDLYQALYGIYGDGPLPNIIGLIGDLHSAYNTLEKSTARTQNLGNGRRVFRQDLFSDELYEKMETVFRQISDYYIDHPDVFVAIPPVPKPAIPQPSTPTPAAHKRRKGRSKLVQTPIINNMRGGDIGMGEEDAGCPGASDQDDAALSDTAAAAQRGRKRPAPEDRQKIDEPNSAAFLPFEVKTRYWSPHEIVSAWEGLVLPGG
ncbi:hypothetical protein HDZ31DRAFT_64680 [Schizophyllum fasciatum]